MTLYASPRPAGLLGLVVSPFEVPPANSSTSSRYGTMDTGSQPSIEETHMAVRPSVRFDVFKRDAFTCSYCGRKPPEVTLEADHIIPVAEGGTDRPENLTTACWDCNRGKGARMLDAEPPAVPDLAERTEQIRERELQLRAYHQAIEESSRRQDEMLDRVWNAWFEEWGQETLPRNNTPGKAALRRYLDELGEHAVMEAIEAAGDKFRYISNSAVRYFFGVLKWKLAYSKGLVVDCAKCGKRVMLEDGDDPTLEWCHTGCLEDAADG